MTPCVSYPLPDASHTMASFPNAPRLLAPVVHFVPAPPSLHKEKPHPDLSIGLNDTDTAWEIYTQVYEATGIQGRDIRGIVADLNLQIQLIYFSISRTQPLPLLATGESDSIHILSSKASWPWNLFECRCPLSTLRSYREGVRRINVNSRTLVKPA
jgi:hypothetical protein